MKFVEDNHYIVLQNKVYPPVNVYIRCIIVNNNTVPEYIGQVALLIVRNLPVKRYSIVGNRIIAVILITISSVVICKTDFIIVFNLEKYFYVNKNIIHRSSKANSQR